MLLIRIYCEVGGEDFNEYTFYTNYSIGDWGSALTKETDAQRVLWNVGMKTTKKLKSSQGSEHLFEVSTDYEPKYCTLIAYPVTKG